jgi:antitoxin ParD1/3/4
MIISVPDALKSFVDRQVSSRGLENSSEYIRELIRKDQERQVLRDLLLPERHSALCSSAEDGCFQGGAS